MDRTAVTDAQDPHHQTFINDFAYDAPVAEAVFPVFAKRVTGQTLAYVRGVFAFCDASFKETYNSFTNGFVQLLEFLERVGIKLNLPDQARAPRPPGE